MASQTIKCGTGFWMDLVTGGVQYSYIFGHTFNPPVPSWWGDPWYDADVAGETYIFNVTGLRPGHEAVSSFHKIIGPYFGGYITIRWKDNSGTTFSSSSTYIPSFGAGLFTVVFSYIGLRPASRGNSAELDYNGNYIVEAELDGVGTVSKAFSVNNLDLSSLTLHTSSSGYVWVEGNYLTYISYLGTKHFILHDGSTYGYVGTDQSGYVWIPDSAGVKYIEYIDASGYKRRTKNGDTDGYWAFSDGVGSTGHTPGYLWSQGYSNWHALMFINYSGVQVRIGNGYIYGNEY